MMTVTIETEADGSVTYTEGGDTRRFKDQAAFEAWQSKQPDVNVGPHDWDEWWGSCLFGFGWMAGAFAVMSVSMACYAVYCTVRSIVAHGLSGPRSKG